MSMTASPRLTCNHLVAYYAHEHGCGVPGIGRQEPPEIVGPPPDTERTDTERDVRRPRHDAASGDEAFGDPGRRQSHRHPEARPRETALPQSRSHQRYRRAVD